MLHSEFCTPGEITLITGGTGTGKTQLLSTVAVNCKDTRQQTGKRNRTHDWRYVWVLAPYDLSDKLMLWSGTH